MKATNLFSTYFFALGILLCTLTACNKKICENTCPFNSDGVCDDGGDGSEYDVCQLGTDCNDCGDRKE